MACPPWCPRVVCASASWSVTAGLSFEAQDSFRSSRFKPARALRVPFPGFCSPFPRVRRIPGLETGPLVISRRRCEACSGASPARPPPFPPLGGGKVVGGVGVVAVPLRWRQRRHPFSPPRRGVPPGGCSVPVPFLSQRCGRVPCGHVPRPPAFPTGFPAAPLAGEGVASPGGLAGGWGRRESPGASLPSGGRRLWRTKKVVR